MKFFSLERKHRHEKDGSWTLWIYWWSHAGKDCSVSEPEDTECLWSVRRGYAVLWGERGLCIEDLLGGLLALETSGTAGGGMLEQILNQVGDAVGGKKTSQ